MNISFYCSKGPKPLLDVAAVYPNSIKSSALKNSRSHQIREQEFICRNSVGLLARIKSSQPEGLKVSLVSSHTAFIRGNRGKEWMNGWMERIKGRRNEMQTSQRWSETGKMCVWLLCSICVSYQTPCSLSCLCAVRVDLAFTF